MQNKLFAHIYFGAVDPYKEDVPIQIFKLNTMNQQQLVEQVFQTLLNQGTTTTLDVKNKLRQDYPGYMWDQNFVSTCCREYQEDSDNITFANNGVYREYYLIMGNNAAQKYSYTTSKGVKLETYSWEEMVKSAALLGDTIHWSQNNQKFYSIDEMHDSHLLNAMLLDLESIEREVQPFVEYLQKSPYIKELIKRYPV